MEHLLGGKVANDDLSAEEIYSALLDDDGFANLPSRLAQAFGGRSTLIHWHHSDGSAEVLAHSQYFSDEQLQRYARDFAHLDPWAQASARQQVANCAMDLERLVPAAIYERSVFYNEFIRGMDDDTYRCMGVRIASDLGAGMIAIQRGKSQGSYDPDSVERLSQAAVHLRRVLAIRGKLAALQHRARSLESMLDCVPQAAFSVDESGTLLFANAAAETMLRHSDTLCIRRRKLESVGDRSAQLLKAIRLACSPVPSGSAILLEDRRGRPVVSTVMPLLMPGKPPGALILIQDRSRANAGVRSQLQSLYGLTAAEALIAQRLADGLSLPEIAEERKVSLATVRAQVKYVSQKMNCHRQAEVVSVVKSIIPIPPAIEPIPPQAANAA